MKHAFSIAAVLTAFALSSLPAGAFKNPVSLAGQGSFFAGGSVVTRQGAFDPAKPFHEDGQTLHGDHAYVFWQKPVNARAFPLVFLHGAASTGKAWETTPDGREGFADIFLERGYGTYIVDQPRRGRAGRATVDGHVRAFAGEQSLFGTGRIGKWPKPYPGVQMKTDEKTLDQHYRAFSPNTAPFDRDVISDAVAAVFERCGKAVLVAHSQGGGIAWLTTVKSNKVRAVVAYEPGYGFLFPEDELPSSVPTKGHGRLRAFEVPPEEFEKLTKIPILLIYGDNIPAEPTDDRGQERWRGSLAMARLWAETVNRHGGDVTLIHLPEIGIYGNTHFLFQNLNNEQIADVQEKWMREKGLDVR